ncbi:MAG TPA: diacylglycerol kinase [Gammaproteobacteria bacterium]|nr:diacylglycerol kinase [Gammaproteobacteria bacterium]
MTCARRANWTSAGPRLPETVSEFFDNRGLLRAWRALGYSLKGLAAAWRHESAFRQEVLIALIVLPLGLWLGEGGVEKALLAGSWLLVLVVELLNSAIEAVVDRFGPEHHPLAGRAKDLGSAAVFVAILQALLVWGLLLGGLFI